MSNFFDAFSDKGSILTVVASAACGVLLGWYLHESKSILSEQPVTKVTNPVECNRSSDDECDLTDLEGFDMYGNFKMVIVVRQDLKMGKGKIAAQCSHAAVGAYKQLYRKNEQLLRFWEYNGQPKVVVKCHDEMELLALQQQAKSLGVTATIIQDAGRTQVASGSKTVLGVGPAAETLVDRITGHLKLL